METTHDIYLLAFSLFGPFPPVDFGAVSVLVAVPEVQHEHDSDAVVGKTHIDGKRLYGGL